MEPVTVAEAKLAARVDGSELDAYIAGAISAARECAEQVTGRVYRRKIIAVDLADWPLPTDRLHMPFSDTVAVDYWDGSAWLTLDPSGYAFEADSTGTYMAPALDTSWPVLGRRAIGHRVRITLTAGPVDPSTVTETVKLYIKAQVAAWIRSPEAIAGTSATRHPLLDNLLDSERLWS